MVVWVGKALAVETLLLPLLLLLLPVVLLPAMSIEPAVARS
jgi:hypothetical protein